MAINRYYPSTSTEALAEAHIRDHIFYDPTITIETMARCAAYAAVLRYITTGDEYPIAPRNARELQAVLINHSVDVIHSLISQTRAQIPTGGYREARDLARSSIISMLHTSDNAASLLALHVSPIIPNPHHDAELEAHNHHHVFENGSIHSMHYGSGTPTRSGTPVGRL